ncbi:MAG: bis(5'-nucleosyl)-tetraphosphatase [Candidatus Gracilibacteria bacterium]|jgi:8-oxo-dGTP pyrophosphatase MutT (NUDIX family)
MALKNKKIDEISCGIVIFRIVNNERLFLLLHYPGGHWDLVKGHIEKGENEKETASRELLEETGISDITYVDGFREEILYEYSKNDSPSLKKVIFFLGLTSEDTIKISHEHRDFTWLTYEEAMTKITYQNAKNILNKAEIFLKNIKGFSL